MEIAVSAVASEVAGRLVSFLISKYRGQARPNKKENLESLRRLLLRVHTVVEEAEGRYITNSRMLLQLKTLTEAMYQGQWRIWNHTGGVGLSLLKLLSRLATDQGYDALDIHAPLEQIRAHPEVSGSSDSMDFRSFNSAAASKEVPAALRALETASAEIAEFIALLAGCERMPRTPYSCYLHIDNFMFGRRVERQRVINVLMQDEDGHPPLGAPTVLPIIGGRRVGKKTLVWSVCSDDRIRSRFPSILHVDGREIQRIDRGRFVTPPVRTLIVVEFLADVDDREWHGFLSLLRALTGAGSKVVILSRLEKVARFGTVNLVRISSFSPEEYGYLFKVLAFGSSDPGDHPRLALIGKELATMMEGSLVHLNVYSSVLRNNLNVQFWSRVLKLYRTVTEANLSVFGEHPRALLDRGSTVDITRFSPSSATSLRFTLLIGGRDSSGPGELTRMTFGDIIAGSVALPMKFELVWESRLPPYTVISGTCVAEKPPQSASPRKKRRR